MAPRSRVEGSAGARARRGQAAALRDVGLRDRRDDRSGDAEPLRRRRPEARVLRDRVLTHVNSQLPTPQLPTRFLGVGSCGVGSFVYCEWLPEAVLKDLQERGHDVGKLRPFGMSGCATVVMIDPATQNRFAGADPRRECYAIAY